MKKKKGQKRTGKTAIGLGAIDEFEGMLQLTKEDMENALKSPAIRIHGVLYDVPVFQLQNYLKINKFGLVKIRLVKAQNQDQSQTNTINESK